MRWKGSRYYVYSLLNHTFAIIFSVLPSGYSDTSEIIIFLPPQLRKADGNFYFPLCSSPSHTSSLLRQLLQELSSTERTDRRNLTGVAVTLQRFTNKQMRADSDTQFQLVS